VDRDYPNSPFTIYHSDWIYEEEKMGTVLCDRSIDLVSRWSNGVYRDDWRKTPPLSVFCHVYGSSRISSHVISKTLFHYASF
jgi:hypothetical protein